MKKLASFTMMELVVGMLISSIVISIVFYSYSVVRGQLLKRQAESSKAAEVVLFQRAFRRDFERAERIDDSAGGGSLLLRAGDQVIRYSIDTTFITRTRAQEGITDTFFLGGRVAGLEHFSDSLPLVKSLLINLEVNKETPGVNREVLGISFNKDYTAGELLRAEKDKPD